MGRRYLILLVLLLCLGHLALALEVATIYNGESRWPANLKVGEWGQRAE